MMDEITIENQIEQALNYMESAAALVDNNTSITDIAIVSIAGSLAAIAQSLQERNAEDKVERERMENRKIFAGTDHSQYAGD